MNLSRLCPRTLNTVKTTQYYCQSLVTWKTMQTCLPWTPRITKSSKSWTVRPQKGSAGSESRTWKDFYFNAMGLKNIDSYTFEQFDLIQSCLSVMLGTLHYFQCYKHLRPKCKKEEDIAHISWRYSIFMVFFYTRGHLQRVFSAYVSALKFVLTCSY